MRTHAGGRGFVFWNFWPAPALLSQFVTSGFLFWFQFLTQEIHQICNSRLCSDTEVSLWLALCRSKSPEATSLRKPGGEEWDRRTVQGERCECQRETQSGLTFLPAGLTPLMRRYAPAVTVCHDSDAERKPGWGVGDHRAAGVRSGAGENIQWAVPRPYSVLPNTQRNIETHAK